MSGFDLLPDQVPHGTVEGFRAGCKTNHCPAAIPCHTFASRYAGDYGFRKLVDGGMDAAAIAEWEQTESRRVQVAAAEAELERRRVLTEARLAEREAEKVARAEERAAARRSVREERERARAAERAAAAETRAAERALSRRARSRDDLVAAVEKARERLQQAMEDLEHFDSNPQPAVRAEPSAPRAPRERKPRREPKPRVLQPHGTNASYARGCRCEECHAAHLQYHRDYVAKRKAAGADGYHGTAYGYQLGCNDRDACPGGADGVTCSDASLSADIDRRRRAGIEPAAEKVPAEPVRAHVRSLMDAGIPFLTVAERAEVSKSVVKALLYGKRGRVQIAITAAHAERLLAVAA